MAFAYDIQGRSVFGDRRIAWGTFTNGGSDSGGDVKTGLSQVHHISLTHTGAAVVASAPSVNETMPLNKGDVTIVTVTGADGTWFAVGK
jgi:hypothetical protein